MIRRLKADLHALASKYPERKVTRLEVQPPVPLPAPRERDESF